MRVPEKITPKTVLKHGEGFVHAEVHGEVVALDIQKGTCYGLNKVGSKIWTNLQEPISIHEICTKLTEEYEVEHDVCEREVIALLEELHCEGLIKIVER